MGKDNEGMEMVPVIVHMWHYAISKERKKKWGRNRHVSNIQDGPSVTNRLLTLWPRKSASIPREMEGIPGLGEPVGQPVRHERQGGDKGV